MFFFKKIAVDKTIALLAVMDQNSGKVPLPDVLVGAYGMIDGATNSLAVGFFSSVAFP